MLTFWNSKQVDQIAWRGPCNRSEHPHAFSWHLLMKFGSTLLNQVSSGFLQKIHAKKQAAQRAHFRAHRRTFAHTGAHSKSALFNACWYVQCQAFSAAHILFCSATCLVVHLLSFSWLEVHMSSRLLSNNTLLEGMQAVDFKGSSENADRKRALELKIEARPCAWCAVHMHWLRVCACTCVSHITCSRRSLSIDLLPCDERWATKFCLTSQRIPKFLVFLLAIRSISFYMFLPKKKLQRPTHTHTHTCALHNVHIISKVASFPPSPLVHFVLAMVMLGLWNRRWLSHQAHSHRWLRRFRHSQVAQSQNPRKCFKMPSHAVPWLWKWARGQQYQVNWGRRQNLILFPQRRLKSQTLEMSQLLLLLCRLRGVTPTISSPLVWCWVPASGDLKECWGMFFLGCFRGRLHSPKDLMEPEIYGTILSHMGTKGFWGNVSTHMFWVAYIPT